MWPHRWQPTRLPHPWDSLGKNTGVGCHFLLQCMKVKSQSEVAQSCSTLSDPMDCSPPGSSVHGIFQARVLEWGAISFSIRCAMGVKHEEWIRALKWLEKYFMKEVKVAQSCPTLCDPIGYTVHGILQARILEWVAFPFSRGSFQPRDRTQVSCIAGRLLTSWATREVELKLLGFVGVC